MWCTWKKNKCKPDMEKKFPLPEEEHEPSNKHVSQPLLLLQPPQHFCLVDLALEKSIAIPNVYKHLKEYMDALDPDVGIEMSIIPNMPPTFVGKP